MTSRKPMLLCRINSVSGSRRGCVMMGILLSMGLGFRMKHLRDELTPCAASALVWR